jgi:hypothetical protein
MKKRKAPSKGKIRNATPTEVDGIKFKSKLEAYTYQKLKQNNIPANYETVKFTILDSFTYDGKRVQEMTYTPDFTSDDFIIECKGYANESFPLRWKIFKYFLLMNKLEYNIYKPKNIREVDEMIETIIKRRDG